MSERAIPEKEQQENVRDRTRSKRLTRVLALMSVLFLALWAWTEMRLRAEREETRSVAAEKGTLEGESHRSAFREKLESRRSGGEPDISKVVMQPPGESGDISGRVFVDHTSGRVFGLFRGLDGARSGMTYQLWFYPERGAPVSMGQVGVDEEGEGVAASTETVQSPTGEFRLTLEQSGGALVPTGQEILRGVHRPSDAAATDITR